MADRMFVATRKGLFQFDRNGGGAGWAIGRTSFLGDNVSQVLAHPERDTVFAALDHGHFGVKLHRSDDRGVSWVECTPPSLPERPPDAAPDLDGGGKPFPGTVVLLWSLEFGGGPDGREVWCGTIPGALFHSGDGGESWTLVRSLWEDPARNSWFGGGYDSPGIHSICVDPRSASRLSVGVSCGGVWVSEDAGDTWSCAKGMRAAYMPPEREFEPYIQDPHRLVQCPGEPDHCWVQHHNGVFRSTDGGTSWSEIPDVRPSNFGFAVAVHPRDPETAWLVPGLSDEHRIPVGGRVVVARTRDGGKSFEVLDRGLPQQHAYDIAFRHALAVDETGEVVAFGSTTGSLWASRDQGDSWQTISEHLPPIYSVRMV